MADRPTESLPDWFVTDPADRVEPLAEKKLQGWQPDEPLPAQSANWLLYSISLWLDYLVYYAEEVLAIDLAALTGRVDDAEDRLDDAEDRLDDAEDFISTVETESRLVATGTIEPWLFSVVKTGWLALNGQTIGSAASGANYANADAEALFTLFWNDYDNTALPILDSSGSPTTRGASAAADFAANKRLPIFNAEGLVARGTGTQAINGRNKVGPSIGEKQEDQMQRITGSIGNFFTGSTGGTNVAGAFSWSTIATNTGGSGSSQRRITVLFNSANSPDARASSTTAGETRASSFGVRWIIKL